MIIYRDTVLVADKPTKNKHIYPRELLESEVARLQDIISCRALVGQMGYPSDSLIHLDNASHVITKLFMDGDNMIAEIETLHTPNGMILEESLNNDLMALRPYGVGYGVVDENGILTLNDSYKMVSISVVEADKAA